MYTIDRDYADEIQKSLSMFRGFPHIVAPLSNRILTIVSESIEAKLGMWPYRPPIATDGLDAMALGAISDLGVIGGKENFSDWRFAVCQCFIDNVIQNIESQNTGVAFLETDIEEKILESFVAKDLVFGERGNAWWCLSYLNLDAFMSSKATCMLVDYPIYEMPTFLYVGKRNAKESNVVDKISKFADFWVCAETIENWSL